MVDAPTKPCPARRIYGGGCHTANIIARVLVEILVLGRDKRVFDQIRDFFGRRKQATLYREFVDDPPLARINPADCFGGVAGQDVIRRKVTAIHPKDATDGDSRHHHAQREHGKQTAKDRQNKTQHVLDPYKRFS